MILNIWTDGSCDWKTRFGGYAYVVEDFAGRISSSYGSLTDTTSPRAELTGVIEALESIPNDSEAIVSCDSEYVVKGVSMWMEKWSQTGWKIKNPDLWKQLYKLIERKNLTVHAQWVRGHSGDEYNEECDRLAELGRKQAGRDAANC